MVKKLTVSKLTPRTVAVGMVVLFSVVPILWAAGGPKRARPPKWSKRDSEVFFTDAREKLIGQRPSAGGHSASPAVAAGSGTTSGGDNAPAASEGGTFAWSNLISSDTIEAEVKLLQKDVSDTVQTPAQFKGGGYKDGRRQFTELAMLLAIIAEYDGDVRWKQSASGMRDLVGRAGMNCKVGTDASFNEAKLRKEDLEKLVRGEAPQVERGEPKTKWDKVAGRPPLMQRLEKAQQQGVAVWTADQGEFKKNAEKLEREAEILAAIAEVIQREGFEFSDDADYLGYAKQMRDAAKTVAEAARNKNYDQARKASGDISKACSSCHEGYRS
jgi:cytochrome c556